MSKNELKRQEKLKRLEEEKKKKAEAKGDQPKKDEEIKDPNLYYENRMEEVKKWKTDEKMFPFPHKFNYTHNIT